MDKKPKYPRVNFNVGSCSSEDSDCPVSELLLQSPECKGWQSSRYCSYPQVIVLQLSGLYLIRQITVLSHQYKISSRVEVDYKTETDTEYRRLGHFSMGSNQESNFQVRELKNIPVGISCNTVRLTLHKNHINKYNVFNQIGVISVCFYGQQGLPQATGKPVVYPGAETRTGDDKAEKGTLKMLRDLEIQKREAVDDEDYEKASAIKLKIDEIRKVSSQLEDLEERKKIAVQREDYDTARVLHQEIRRLRDRFENGGKQLPGEPPRHASQELHREKSRTQQYQQQEVSAPKKPVQQVFKQQQPPPRKQQPFKPKNPINVDDIPINVKNLNPYEDPDQQPPEDADFAPKNAEPLKAEPYKLCQGFFGVIPQQIFRKVFSRHHTLRQEGVQEAKQALMSSAPQDKSAMMRAVLLIVKVSMEDKIANVIIRSFDLLEQALRKLRPKLNDPNVEIILSRLSDYQGHTSDKIKSIAFQTMAELPNHQLTNKALCIDALSHPEGKKSPKILTGRLEMLKRIVEEHGAGSEMEDCAIFSVKNLEDKNNEVRNAAVELMRVLIDQVGYQKVSPFIKNLRPALLKLFQDSGLREEMPSNRQQVPIQKKTVNRKAEQETATQKSSKSKIRPEQPPADQCPYCCKRDPQFANDDFRDIHLYNTCPMLMLCECQQAVEVSTFTAHLTSECKNSKYFKRCPRCKQAVHQGKYKAHVQAKDCNPAKPLAVNSRCPLCHQDISPGAGGWKEHLADQGCPNHSR